MCLSSLKSIDVLLKTIQYYSLLGIVLLYRLYLVFTLRIPSCLLQLLMCGTGKYSVTDFKAHAVIDGTSYSFFKVKIYRPSS